MCSCLEDLHDSLNEYFPNHQCMTSYACRKDPCQVQDRPADSGVIKQEMFTNVASDSIWQTTFKEAPLVKVGCSIKGKYPQPPGKALNVPSLTFNYVSM